MTSTKKEILLKIPNISGYASIFTVQDHQKDIIIPGAFSKTLARWRKQGKWPRMLWQHDAKKPIGVWTHLFEDKIGLYARGRLILGVQQAEEALLLLRHGAIDSLSIGFRPTKVSRDPITKVRTIREIDLLEISLVTFGANRFARVYPG